LYLVRTQDPARNVRASRYVDVEQQLADRRRTVELRTPVERDIPAAIGCFTGTVSARELERIHLLPGAIAEEFPDIGVLLPHYLRGNTLLEAHWKIVAMAGQGLFIGEPLPRHFASRP
jgi:hypothetical protein